MDIYIEDTGIVNPDFTTATSFTNYSTASTAEKQKGEFRVEGALLLKANSIQLGESINQTNTGSLFKLENKTLRTSNSNLRFTISGYATKAKQQKYTDAYISANTGGILEDLPDLKKLMTLALTKGHKDLYIKDSTSTEIEKLFWLYYMIDLFGKTDAGNTLSKKHINVLPVSFSGNEGINSAVISWNMVFDIDFNIN